jgi:spore coat polysaccharide biosynthesis predicted glycosyltransferase SpsG
MGKADLAISSAGRTVTELISLGVPVLCLCQNEKELTHTHASARFGVINLGLGFLVDPSTIAAHIRRLIDSVELRRTLRERALHESADRTNAAVIGRIMAKLELG